MPPKTNEEWVEEMFDTVYHTGEQPNLNKDFLRTLLTVKDKQREKADVQAYRAGYLAAGQQYYDANRELSD